MKHHVVVYDIPDDGRRDKVATILASYGERVQLSVFECWLDKARKNALINELENVIDRDDDLVRIYAIQGKATTLGAGKPLEPPESYIV
ncbi:CRISPR-associated endonuclease Cas2 [Oceanithermus sp.]